MADQPSPSRRFQFRLRTLMIGVTLFCVVVGGYIGSQVRIVKDRSAMRTRLLAEGDLLKPPNAQGGNPENSPSWFRRLLGDINTPGICRPQAREDIEDEQVQLLFPEAELSGYFTLNPTPEPDPATQP